MRLREHHIKPRPRLFGKDTYYLGIELEVEAPDCDKRDEGLEKAGKRPPAYYAKRDSSLNQWGWELVTHPVARNLWVPGNQKPSKPVPGNQKPSKPVDRFFQLVRDLAFLGYTSHDGGRCGLHVHVSKTAFGKRLKCPHYYWFCRVVNGQLFCKLSQRTGETIDRWAAQSPVKVKGFAGYRGSRYWAVNQTSATVEVRIFRGNMREARIRKAIEAVVAAVEFARTRTSRNWGEDLDTAFVLWVSKNQSSYPNLYAYLGEIGAVRSSDVSVDHMASSSVEVPVCA